MALTVPRSTPGAPRVRRRARRHDVGQLPADARRGPRSRASGARRASAGTTTADELVGVGLVLLRQVPKVKKFLAYLPEGPVIDWAADDLAAWLDADGRAPAGGAGAFGVKMGPLVARPPLVRGDGEGRDRRRLGPAARRRTARRGRPGGRAGRGDADRGWAGGRRRTTRGSRPGSRSTSSRCRSPGATRRSC